MTAPQSARVSHAFNAVFMRYVPGSALRVSHQKAQICLPQPQPGPASSHHVSGSPLLSLVLLNSHVPVGAESAVSRGSSKSCFGATECVSRGRRLCGEGAPGLFESARVEALPAALEALESLGKVTGNVALEGLGNVLQPLELPLHAPKHGPTGQSLGRCRGVILAHLTHLRLT